MSRARSVAGVLTLGLAIGFVALPTQAAPIQITMAFDGGFDLSVDGAPAAPSGALTFRLFTDNSTPDLDGNSDRGRFLLTSVLLDAPGLGISGRTVVAPSPLYIDSYLAGFTLIGAGFIPDIGWNGGPSAASLMGDLNDLSTLPIGTFSVTNSTFFLETITLDNGVTLFGATGRNGPDGTFLVEAAGGVPEPGSLSLMLAGAALLATRAIRRKLI